MENDNKPQQPEMKAPPQPARPDALSALTAALAANQPFVLVVAMPEVNMTFANGHVAMQLGLIAISELHVKDRVIAGITRHD